MRNRIQTYETGYGGKRAGTGPCRPRSQLWRMAASVEIRCPASDGRNNSQ
jgi:hypothetical protein